MSPQELRVIAYLWLNPGCTVSEVRASAPEPSALATLRRLRARGYARRGGRLWSVTRVASELMAVGSRLSSAGLGAFRGAPERKEAVNG